MISDFLLRADAFTPSASAMASNCALSFDSRTDCSSACAVTLTSPYGWRTVGPLCAAPSSGRRAVGGGIAAISAMHAPAHDQRLIGGPLRPSLPTPLDGIVTVR